LPRYRPEFLSGLVPREMGTQSISGLPRIRVMNLLKATRPFLKFRLAPVSLKNGYVRPAGKISASFKRFHSQGTTVSGGRSPRAWMKSAALELVRIFEDDEEKNNFPPQPQAQKAHSKTETSSPSMECRYDHLSDSRRAAPTVEGGHRQPPR
jgi:hypothetical protein